MKTKLLKLALCAMAMLPIGAWAQTVVSDQRSWNFSTWTTETSITDVTELNGLYIHGGTGTNHNIVGNASSNQTITLSDGTSSNDKNITFAASYGQTTNPSAQTAANSTSIDRCFAFKTNVAGTCYATMRFSQAYSDQKLQIFFNGEEKAVSNSVNDDSDKALRELRVTVDAGGTFYIKGTTRYMVAAIKFVPTVTTWSINVGTYDSSGLTSMTYVNGLCVNPKSGRSVSFSSYKTPIDFSDGATYSIGRKVTLEGAFGGDEADPIANAMSSRRLANAGMNYDYVAFDVAEAGTAYVIMKTNSAAASGRVLRILFQAADKSYTYKEIPATATATEMKLSCTGPGTYFIYGSQRLDIYAIHFTRSKFQVNVTEALYASFSSPINVAIPSGVEAYWASAKNGGKITLTKIEDGVIPANEGVVLKATEAGYKYFERTEDSAPTLTGNMLKPNLVSTQIADTYYTLAVDGTAPVFRQSTGVGYLDANKAYLDISGAEARQYSIVFDNETTGIAEMKTMRNVENDNFYNLSGQRVAQPTRGLYIVNGKKVVIK